MIAYSDRKPSVVKKQCIEAVRAMGSPRGKATLAENVYRGIVDQLPKAASPASPAPHARLSDRIDAGSSRLRQSSSATGDRHAW